MPNLRSSAPAILAGCLAAGLSGCAERGPIPDRPAPVDLVHLSTVGCLECDGPELFDAVFSAFPLGDSAVAVINGSDPRVRLFDLDGRPVDQWGRTGEGPGEFETYVLDAVPSPDGILALSRPPEAWRPDGSHVGEVPVLNRKWGGVNGFQRWRMAATSPSSEWLARAGDREYEGIEYFEMQLVNLVSRDSIRYRVPDDIFDESDPGSRNSFWILPAVRDDGAWAVIGTLDYDIRLFSPDGEPIARATRGTPRIERSPEEIEAAKNRTLPRPLPDGTTPPEPVVAKYIGQVSRAAFFDPSNRLWVLTRDGDLDVFTPDLAYLGTVGGLPEGVFRLQIRGDLVVVIHTGDLGDSHVSTYRIQEATADG